MKVNREVLRRIDEAKVDISDYLIMIAVFS